MSQVQNFCKGIPDEEGWPILPTVEFTEDEWNTIYTGHCVNSTFYSYLVHSAEYGTFWIPKTHVRLATKV
jgi:hypothetical protein